MFSKNWISEKVIFKNFKKIKIILSDQKHFLSDCYVKFEDYIEVKRKLYEEEIDSKMPPEIELEEYRKFNLIDSDKSCAITWNEYVEFETANILSKRNKVILLITVKEKILNFKTLKF